MEDTGNVTRAELAQAYIKRINKTESFEHIEKLLEEHGDKDESLRKLENVSK